MFTIVLRKVATGRKKILWRAACGPWTIVCPPLV